VTLVCFLVPVLVLWLTKVIGDHLAVGLAMGGALLVPLLLYRSSRSWQLMLYYSFLPQHLPANRRQLKAEDENI
jgi:hypothetical protein